MPDHHARRRRSRAAYQTLRAGDEFDTSDLRVRAAAANRARHGEGRRRLRPLRIVCRALSYGRLGHAKIRPHYSLCRSCMHDVLRTRVNDFAVKLANVNGTGSASANGLLMQAIFRMGIPVCGKNLFPSNIQGLPTWYEIRVNKDGYAARALDYDLMVAMNSQTYDRDIKEVRPGGYLLYDSSWPLDPDLHREDITFLGVPLAELCNQNFDDPRVRILMKNIAYAGAMVATLDIDMDVVNALLEEKFAAKKALHESNRKALLLGYNHAKDHFDCPLPFRLEKMDGNKDKILIDGNTATALG